jgi:hypothetical protein
LGIKKERRSGGERERERERERRDVTSQIRKKNAVAAEKKHFCEKVS